MTVNELVTHSLRLIGVLSAVDTASAEDADVALTALNDLVEEWNLERLMIYESVDTTKTLTSGTQSYTIGSGGDIDIVRPVFIDGANIISNASSPAVEQPMAVLTESEWAGIGVRTVTSALPHSLYYEPSYPLGTIWLYPVPSDSTAQIKLWVPTPVAALGGLAATLSLPPGYRKALIYNLAVELYSWAGRQADPVVVGIAIRTKANIKNANVTPHYLTCDPAIVSPGGQRKAFNWLTGE